jgi:hypothetical protein
MSEMLYTIRLFFDPMRGGCIRVPGRTFRLTRQPLIGGLPLYASIDYAPETKTYLIHPAFAGQREMTAGEIATVTAWMQGVMQGTVEPHFCDADSEGES